MSKIFRHLFLFLFILVFLILFRRSGSRLALHRRRLKVFAHNIQGEITKFIKRQQIALVLIVLAEQEINVFLCERLVHIRTKRDCDFFTIQSSILADVILDKEFAHYCHNFTLNCHRETLQGRSFLRAVGNGTVTAIRPITDDIRTQFIGQNTAQTELSALQHLLHNLNLTHLCHLILTLLGNVVLHDQVRYEANETNNEADERPHFFTFHDVVRVDFGQVRSWDLNQKVW
mmetsp:Transcript_12068/g.18197  ORF Transcript_12068/g.18197 Transcript_12068/m.18197 type:complete len:231 (-) Transcript_12068:637-1329(-)